MLIHYLPAFLLCVRIAVLKILLQEDAQIHVDWLVYCIECLHVCMIYVHM